MRLLSMMSSRRRLAGRAMDQDHERSIANRIALRPKVALKTREQDIPVLHVPSHMDSGLEFLSAVIIFMPQAIPCTPRSSLPTMTICRPTTATESAR